MPEARVEGDDYIVELNWTTAGNTVIELWTSEDTEAWELSYSDTIASDEQNWVVEYGPLMLAGLYVRARVYGDGVQYPTESYSESNYLLLS